MLLESYQGLKDDELKGRIFAAKAGLGKKLVILGHHYQREEVIEFADFRGDSYGLSKIASEQKEADFIVFCGVNFMAEAAKILARPNQRVFHPDLTAGCPMADMAELDDVETAWNDLAKATDIKKVIPIAYMNTTAELKAFCGENGGLICTSSNAPRAFDWAFARGEKIFFFPDEHLGRNTARKKGISKNKLVIWDVANVPAYQRTNAQLILWPGFCHVHTHFTLEHIKEARKKYPKCKIIVHPECMEEVVLASDESASTEGICKFIAAEPKGATIIVGTEINLISRLAHENPDKNVVPLARSLCPNMFKISLQDLCWTVESLAKGEYVNEVIVPCNTSKSARIALDRMLLL
jgi:quinolinate synthase